MILPQSADVLKAIQVAREVLSEVAEPALRRGPRLFAWSRPCACRSLLSFVVVTALVTPAPTEELRSIGGLPAHLAGAIDDISACHLSPEGEFLIFDRRAHAVYSAAPEARTPRRRSCRSAPNPAASSGPARSTSAPNGTFVVADSPGGRPRFQFFFYTGRATGRLHAAGTRGPADHDGRHRA